MNPAPTRRVDRTDIGRLRNEADGMLSIDDKAQNRHYILIQMQYKINLFLLIMF